MGSATRMALAAGEDALAAQKGVTLATGEQILAAGRAIERSAQLRSILADQAVESSEKSALIGRIFGSLDAAATALLGGLATSRWSNQGEFLGGIERIGIRAVAASAGARTDLVSELVQIERAVTSDAELELVLGSKLGDPAGKAEIVESLFADKASPATLAIVRHLVQSPRGRRVGELLRSAAATVAAAKDALIADVTAASPLTAAQRTRLTAALTAQYGREPRLNVVVDPAIIGGLRVQVGDQVVDGTVAARLADLRLQLAG